MSQGARPRTLWNHKTGVRKEFPSGGAAKRAVDLDPNWSFTPPDDLLPPSLQKPWIERFPMWMRIVIMTVLIGGLIVLPALAVLMKIISGK